MRSNTVNGTLSRSENSIEEPSCSFQKITPTGQHADNSLQFDFSQQNGQTRQSFLHVTGTWPSLKNDELDSTGMSETKFTAKEWPSLIEETFQEQFRTDHSTTSEQREKQRRKEMMGTLWNA